jgi:Two component regulator propeller
VGLIDVLERMMGDAIELARTSGEMVQRIRHRAIGRAIILCVLWFSCASVRALDLGISLPQFHHTAWTLKDGGPGQVQAIAQTRDGYLWLGTPNGLFRFDGVRFESFDALGDQRLATFRRKNNASCGADFTGAPGVFCRLVPVLTL